MRRITEKRKMLENRGKGHGKDYKPYIRASEINSLGTTSNVVDWKIGRAMELLSQGELYWFYILRWDDNVSEIREQLKSLQLKRCTGLVGVFHFYRKWHRF
jgi:hypothetical protein